MKKNEQYNNQSITSLKGADRVRKRPAVIFGSDGLEGCEHSVFEILSNSVDEAKEGHGDTIYITAYRDLSIEIEDHGRGVPLGWNEGEERWNWDLIYCELYAGGKYDNNSDGAAYEYSLGLNGLGACATQYSSEFFEVRSYDGANVSSISFKKGEPVTELIVKPLSGSDKKQRRTGTVQHWRPDLEVFTEITIPREYYSDMLKRQAVANPGIRFVFRWETTPDSGAADGGKTFDTEEYYYEHGITDYIAELAGDTAETKIMDFHLETKGRDREDMKDYKLIADVAFTMSKSVHMLEYYHNSSFLEHGGSPERAVKTGFTYAIDRYLKAGGKYNKNESKITFADIEDCMIIVTNSFSTQASYANQTKKAITNSFIAEAMTDFIKQQLEYFFAENPYDAERIGAQVLLNKRSREQAESTRLNLKKKLASQTDVSSRVEKFVACRSKDPELRELYIVEGDSALTSCKMSRNADFQAIIPVRGKTLNCMKATYERIFKSEIIVDLLRVIGCGVEIQTKHKTDSVPFDIKNLRWSKIIICTDADEDGYQIRTLLLTLFFRLLPTLLKEGRVYIVESPLYKIDTAGRDSIFAYNEAEKAEITRQLDEAKKKYTLYRSKGLGENEADMMAKTTMSPVSRRLIRVTPSDAAATARTFELMLGDDLPGRKRYIAEHGREYITANLAQM